MASVPTPQSTAEEILRIFVNHFKCRSGHVLRANNFLAVWHTRGLHWEDFVPGMQYADEKEWVEVLGGGTSYRITELGYSAAPVDESNHLNHSTGTQVVNNNTVNIGTAINSPVTQAIGSTVSQSFQMPTPDQLAILLRALNDHISDLHLSDVDRRRVLAQAATISAQLTDEPNPQIVKEAGRTIKNITEGAIGSMIASAAQPGIWLAANAALAMF